MKNNKGFTLVETLAVLVILAIMAAVAVPSMIGYIDSAKEKVYISEAATVSMAVQTYLMEEYARKGEVDTFEFYDDVIMNDLGTPGCPLNDYLIGAYTEGADISELYLDDNYVPCKYLGLKYVVKGYKIELRVGAEPKVEKVSKQKD